MGRLVNAIKYSARRIRNLITGVAKESDLTCPTNQELIDHCLWMLEQMENGMEPLKESRWIGWVFRALEAPPLELITNDTSRDWSRVDAAIGKDT